MQLLRPQQQSQIGSTTPSDNKPQDGSAEDLGAGVVVELDENNIVNETYEKMTPYSYFLFSCAAIGGFLFGYDTGVISSALVNLGDDLGHELSDTESEWATASLSAGALVGGLFCPWIIDRYGRKITLLVADYVIIIGAILITAAYYYEMFVVGRTVMGLGIGASAATSPLYLGELSPTRLRSSMVSIQVMMITGGQVISYCLGAGFTFRYGWRALFGISILPSLIQIGMMHWLPESPRFHILHEKLDEATKTLKIIYKDASEEFIETKLQYIQNNVQHAKKFQQKHSLWTRLGFIFTKGYYFRPTLVAFIIMLSQQLSGFNSLMYYSATIFESAGFSNGPATGIIIAATNFVFTFVSAFCMEKIGKRRTLLIAYVSMIFGLVMCAVAFYYMTKITDGKLIEDTDYPKKWVNVMVGMFVIFIAFYAIGLGNIPWHGAELFPLEIRSLGACIVNTANWGGNLIVSSTYLTMLRNIGAPGTFGFYAGVSTLGCIFAFFFYPELDNLTLEEIRLLFGNSFGVKESRKIRKQKESIKQNREKA